MSTVSRSSKDQEIRDVIAQLDGLLGALRENVEALNAILAPPDGTATPPGKELSSP